MALVLAVERYLYYPVKSTSFEFHQLSNVILWDSQSMPFQWSHVTSENDISLEIHTIPIFSQNVKNLVVFPGFGLRQWKECGCWNSIKVYMGEFHSFKNFQLSMWKAVGKHPRKSTMVENKYSNIKGGNNINGCQSAIGDRIKRTNNRSLSLQVYLHKHTPVLVECSSIVNILVRNM